MRNFLVVPVDVARGALFPLFLGLASHLLLLPVLRRVPPLFRVDVLVLVPVVRLFTVQNHAVRCDVQSRLLFVRLKSRGVVLIIQFAFSNRHLCLSYY